MGENRQSGLGQAEAKAYGAIKVRLGIAGLLLNFSLLAVFAFTPVSQFLVNYIEFYFVSPYIQFLCFALAAGAAFSITDFLFDWYSGYFIEHEFALSNQSPLKWLLERCKSAVLSLAIGLPLSILFYFLIRTLGQNWWWVFASAVFALSILLARIAPALIFPLFYKFTLLGEGEVRERISALLKKEKIPFGEIYAFNMSKNTRKANAGFTGVGGSRRIILSDTLLEKFTPGEIEVIFAHELGHFKGRHILKNIFMSGAIIYLSFFMCGTVYAYTLFPLGFISIDDIAAIPALVFYLSVFSFAIMPATNAVSRMFEREADQYALRSTGMADDFISGMEKLSAVNLADKDPNPAVEFFFHGHPSLSKRITAAEKFRG